MIIDSIRYRDGHTGLEGVLLYDEAVPGRRPGILMVHGGAGLDAHAKDRARRLAELGYVVFACDMFGEGVAGDRARTVAVIHDLRGSRQRICDRAQAGMDVLLASPGVDGRLGAVGYCFGGMAVLELARGGRGVAGVVCVHGRLETATPALQGETKARILVCHGALDPYAPPSHVAAFIEEMNKAAADWQIIVYGQAMHGFTHENATGQTPGVAYHAASDARSSAAIRSFLAELFSD